MVEVTKEKKGRPATRREGLSFGFSPPGHGCAAPACSCCRSRRLVVVTPSLVVAIDGGCCDDVVWGLCGVNGGSVVHFCGFGL